MGVLNPVVKKLLVNGQTAAESFWDSDLSQPAFQSRGKLARLASSGGNDGFRVDRYVAEGCRLMLFEEGTGTAHTVLTATYSTLRGPLTVDGVDPRSLGLGQTWQGVTASRALNTIYTNTTGRPIAIAGHVSDLGAAQIKLTIAGVIVLEPGISLSFFGIVPPGATYIVNLTAGSGSMGNFVELK